MVINRCVAGWFASDVCETRRARIPSISRTHYCGGQREVAFIKMGFAAAAACYLYLWMNIFAIVRGDVTPARKESRATDFVRLFGHSCHVSRASLAILVTFKCKKIKKREGRRDGFICRMDGVERSFLSVAYVTLVTCSEPTKTGRRFSCHFYSLCDFPQRQIISLIRIGVQCQI